MRRGQGKVRARARCSASTCLNRTSPRPLTPPPPPAAQLLRHLRARRSLPSCPRVPSWSSTAQACRTWPRPHCQWPAAGGSLLLARAPPLRLCLLPPWGPRARLVAGVATVFVAALSTACWRRRCRCLRACRCGCRGTSGRSFTCGGVRDDWGGAHAQRPRGGASPLPEGFAVWLMT
jgi:hypothetical protein